MLTQDPIGLAGGVNLYAFPGNNPIAFSDPFGLGPCEDEKEKGKCTIEQEVYNQILAWLNSAQGKLAQGLAALGELGRSFGEALPGFNDLAEGVAGVTYSGQPLTVEQQAASAGAGVGKLMSGKVIGGLAGSTIRSVSVRNQFLLRNMDKFPKWMRGFIERGKVPPGYNVDHRVALSVGGADATSNMRLLTRADHILHHMFYHPWR